jgi:GNAT superfamily N-acetyltransferase
MAAKLGIEQPRVTILARATDELAGLTAGGFEGSVVAIDSRQQSNAFGVCVYRELADIPAAVDLAVVVTASDDILEAIEKCAGAGVKGLVVLSGLDATAEHRRDFERPTSFGCDEHSNFALVLSGQFRQAGHRQNLALGDDYQRDGVGTELVRRLVEVARDELHCVLASTMTDNHGMCAMFRRLGFALSIDGNEVRAELDVRRP